MKLSTLMMIKSITSILLAMILITMPGVILSMVGLPYNPEALIYGRVYGAACAGIFFLTWVARNEKESTARRAILLDLFVYDAIGFIILLVTQIAGGVNALGWLFNAFYLFFALGFGYYLLPQKKNLVNQAMV